MTPKLKKLRPCLLENELATISATIAAQEAAIQQRQAERMNALGAPDAGLPTYEEIMKVVREEEKREMTEKQKLKALEEQESEENDFEDDGGAAEVPPPTYNEALRLQLLRNESNDSTDSLPTIEV